MLNPIDPMVGWFDRLVAEGDEQKLNTLRNMYPIITAEFGETWDAEKFKERCINAGYGSAEAMNALYPERGTMLEDFASELDQALMNIMDKADLSTREREVLLARWMHDGEPLWLEQVAKQRHVTRERIRQIEFKALRKLREHKEELETLFEKRDQLKQQMEALQARMTFLDAIRWRKPIEKYQVEGE